MSESSKTNDFSCISIFNEQIKSRCLDIWENHRKAILVIGTISVILAAVAVTASTMGVGGVIIAALALGATGVGGGIVTGILTFTASALIQVAACAFFKKITAPKSIPNPADQEKKSTAATQPNTKQKEQNKTEPSLSSNTGNGDAPWAATNNKPEEKKSTAKTQSKTNQEEQNKIEPKPSLSSNTGNNEEVNLTLVGDEEITTFIIPASPSAS